MLQADLGQQLAQQVLHGPLLLAIPIAILAGVVSFVSPCVLPLVPGYVAYITGMVGQRDTDHRPGKVLAGSVLFVAGFTAVFVLMGLAIGAVGQALTQHHKIITQIMGVVVIIFGVLMLRNTPDLPGGLHLRWRPQAGLIGAPVLGAIFALGWAPCISPVLGVVLTMGLTTGSLNSAVGLAVAYCVGLGVPFVVVAVGLHRGTKTLGFLHRHRDRIGQFGAVVMIAVGILLVTGIWQYLVDAIRVLAGDFETVI